MTFPHAQTNISGIENAEPNQIRYGFPQDTSTMDSDRLNSMRHYTSEQLVAKAWRLTCVTTSPLFRRIIVLNAVK
jgi:hypothetical protein